MAYYDPNEENPLDPNAPQPNVTGPQSGVISGQGSSPTDAASSPSAPKTPDNPGNFVGIQQYLAQNKPQSAKLAQTVGDYVSNVGENAKEALSQGQSGFEQAVDSNTINLNPDLFEQAKATPEQVAADQAKKAEFQKMRDAQYKGPTSLESSDYYQPINMAIQNALGTGEKTQSAEGRSSLLADMQRQKKERVSRGAANLDAALLSASPESRTILGQTREQLAPLQDQLKAVSEAENLKAQKAAEQTAKTQQAIQAAFSGPGGVQGQLESGLTSKADEAKKKADADAGQVIGLLRGANPNINEAQLNLLGITPLEYQRMLNDKAYYASQNQPGRLDDLSSFATQLKSENQISPQNIASAEDYARYAALNDLMGTSNGFLSDPSMAGKANLDTVDFRKGDVPDAIAYRINTMDFPYKSKYGDNKFTFDQINKTFNANVPPEQHSMAGQFIPAELGWTNLAEAVGGLSYSRRTGDSGPTASSQNQLVSLKNQLKALNENYGVDLKVPPQYFDKARSLVVPPLQNIVAQKAKLKNEGKWNYVLEQSWEEATSFIKPEDIDLITSISAFTTYLDDIRKDPSIIKNQLETPAPDHRGRMNLP